MKRHLLGAAAVTALTAVATHAEEVRVYNWSDYIDEELLTQFEEETGYDLIYDVFDSNELLETKMLAGGSGYDVVVPTGTFLQRQISVGAFQQLDYSKLPNATNLWGVIQDRTEQYDPGGKYSVNYMWGTTGIGYNIQKVEEALGEDAPLDSWSLVFDPANMAKLADCGVHFLDAPAEMIPAALNYIGEDPNSHDPDVIAKAESVFAGIRPYIQKFHSSEYINALANGDICVAVGWSGDVFQAQYSAAEAEKDYEIDYSIPVEGAQMWFDQLAIPEAYQTTTAFESSTTVVGTGTLVITNGETITNIVIDDERATVDGISNAINSGNPSALALARVSSMVEATWYGLVRSCGKIAWNVLNFLVSDVHVDVFNHGMTDRLDVPDPRRIRILEWVEFDIQAQCFDHVALVLGYGHAYSFSKLSLAIDVYVHKLGRVVRVSFEQLHEM